ncbi:hypothetical protein OIU84_016836 [Salix udensis]|uniref:Methyltransferase type 11 domain-containing protein n=1 Tax=Salix udensis TaxID=889485 RepID=A0AAD6JAQ3_9ROSI|nr:hypothetical protein OIU84_016836 [Salix udensis]
MPLNSISLIDDGFKFYVTCREGDVRSLPFGDNYFDVVVSATFVHTVGKEYGHRTVEAAAERMRVLGEMVRVLKPGGAGICPTSTRIEDGGYYGFGACDCLHGEQPHCIFPET